jgi:hypothetical protein
MKMLTTLGGETRLYYSHVYITPLRIIPEPPEGLYNDEFKAEIYRNSSLPAPPRIVTN